MKTINPGQTTLLPRILILHLEISLKNISPRISLLGKLTCPTTKIASQDLWPKMKEKEGLEECVQALLKKRKTLNNRFQPVEPSKRDKSLSLSSDAIMTVEIYPFELIIKTQVPNCRGKVQLKPWIIITIYPYFLMDAVKNLILIDHFLLWALMIYLIKEEVKFYLWSLNSLSQSKVFQPLFSCSQY